MFGGASIQLARIFGIRIGASPSWFFVLFIMIYGLSGYFDDVLVDESNGTAYLVAVVAALLFFVSLVLHELGHATVARRNGIGIAGIDLWFFGGIAKMTRDTRSPGEEFRVAAAGPALALLVWLALINAFLFVFNMVPAFPLDGGRITRAIAWKVTGDRNRGTRFSARLGQIFSYLLVGFGLFLLFTSDAVNGLWFIVLGWFLGQAARGAVVTSRFSERLGGLTVGEFMDRQPVWLPGDTTVLAAQDEV